MQASDPSCRITGYRQSIHCVERSTVQGPTQRSENSANPDQTSGKGSMNKAIPGNRRGLGQTRAMSPAMESMPDSGAPNTSNQGSGDGNERKSDQAGLQKGKLVYF